MQVVVVVVVLLQRKEYILSVGAGMPYQEWEVKGDLGMSMRNEDVPDS